LTGWMWRWHNPAILLAQNSISPSVARLIFGGPF